MRSGSLYGVGYNCGGGISGSLEKNIHQLIHRLLDERRQLTPARPSLGCLHSLWHSLYVHKKWRQLVFCDCQIKGGTLVFLDIGSHEPVSLFGGYSHAAAICADGEIIFINSDTVKNSPSSPIAAFSLPGGEKVTMVACLSKSVFALSSSGRVFASDFESGSCAFKIFISKKSSGCPARTSTASQSAVKVASLKQ